MKTNNRWLTALAGLTFAGLAVPQPGAAGFITDGFFIARVRAPGVSLKTCSGVDTPCTSTTAFGTVTAEAGGSLYPFTVADGSNNFGIFGDTTQGFVHEIYRFRINGPDASVPVIVAYSMTANRFDSDSLAIAQLDVGGNTLHSLDTAQGTSGTFSDSPTLFFAANSEVLVDLLVQGTNNFHAYVDPYITVAPQFLLDHPGYTLDFSSGITNSSPSSSGVPEPGTIVLTIGALVGVVALKGKRGQS